MKDHYDFTGAEQGKFCRPLKDLDIPIYLDKEVKAFFVNKMRDSSHPYSLNNVVNSLLKKDIEISSQITD
jgi:hypothetical protein